MRLIAVGDIHGHRGKLVDLIGKVQPGPDDQLVFLGDYIDRGPDSKGVLDYLMKLQEQYPETVFIRGNHEQMMLDALHEAHPDRLPADWLRLDVESPGFSTAGCSYREYPNRSMWGRNGGLECFESFCVGKDQDEPSRLYEPLLPWDDIPQKYIDFLIVTKIWHRQSGFLFVHAGFRENHLPLDQQRFIMLWDRYAPPGDQEIHVVGHQPSLDGRPFFEESRYSLDTGAAYGRPLTACDVLTKEVWQAI